MTYEDDYVAPTDYKGNPFLQDVAKSKDNRSFQQSPLLRSDHEDPSLHLIGEGLPKPGDSEATWAGRLTDVGTSPFPARADHSHDSFLRHSFMGFVSSPADINACNPGQTLIKHSLMAGENYYVGASKSLILLPQEGLWYINGILESSRVGGGNYTNEMNVVLFYFNGSYTRTVYRNSLATIPQYADVSFTDTVSVGPGATTVEIGYQHNDGVQHQVVMASFSAVRLASAA